MLIQVSEKLFLVHLLVCKRFIGIKVSERDKEEWNTGESKESKQTMISGLST